MNVKRFLGLVGLFILLTLLWSIFNKNIEQRNKRWSKEIYSSETQEWRLWEIRDSMLIDPQTVEVKDWELLNKRLKEFKNESLEDY